MYGTGLYRQKGQFDSSQGVREGCRAEETCVTLLRGKACTQGTSPFRAITDSSWSSFGLLPSLWFEEECRASFLQDSCVLLPGIQLLHSSGNSTLAAGAVPAVNSYQGCNYTMSLRLPSLHTVSSLILIILLGGHAIIPILLKRRLRLIAGWPASEPGTRKQQTGVNMVHLAWCHGLHGALCSLWLLLPASTWVTGTAPVQVGYRDGNP